MSNLKLAVKSEKRIALIAHNERKEDLIEWVKYNKGTLSCHKLFATGNTGKLIMEKVGLNVQRFLHGPLGGDQQIGAAISNRKIDFLIFFWDPLQTHPHEPDVKALLRVAVVWNIPVACNRATADYLVSSPLMHEDYTRKVIDYSKRYS
ncbi:MAG: methylglyoxal synthase [Promethearchaeota archaeon]|nr:MAG: methylglyoxal synthase [Candidatus Lokiarchaeota archaeon]